MVQKARNINTLADAIAANARAIERLESQIRLLKVPQVVSVPSFGGSPSSSTIGDSQNHLDVGGGTMKGPIGFGDTQLIIDINNQIIKVKHGTLYKLGKTTEFMDKKFIKELLPMMNKKKQIWFW